MPKKQKPARSGAPANLALLTSGIFHKHPNYFFLNGSGNYENVAPPIIKGLLEQKFLSAGVPTTRTLITDALVYICSHRSIDNALSFLPGYPVGIIPGSRTLVPQALTVIQPIRGQCPLCDEILFHLLGTTHPEQLEHFNGWLQHGYRCLESYTRKPGQVVFLSGPQGCGKTLVQQEIITPVFGGQKADPYRYATGRTQFNPDLCKAMHLMISDQKNPAYRADMQEFIRQIASNNFDSLHPKGKEAAALDVLWRMSVSCNEDENDLKIIPPLDGLEDKVMLFRCAKYPMPMPTREPAEYKAFQDALRAELPAFLYQILARPVHPRLVDPRFGIKGYLHPELIKMVQRLDREEELYGLICNHKRTNPAWVLIDVTAAEVHKEIWRQDNLRDALRKIALSPRTLGKLLSKLVARNDGTATERTLHGESYYTITP